MTVDLGHCPAGMECAQQSHMGSSQARPELEEGTFPSLSLYMSFHCDFSQSCSTLYIYSFGLLAV